MVGVTSARRRLALILFVVAGAVLTPVQNAPAAEAAATYEMYFPLVGPNRYSDTWGAARSGGRTHKGTDIIADKMTPIVAVSAGTVGWMHDEQGGRCCAMALHHDDGWTSWYIHMNNDTPGTDDGQGWGFAPGITSGVHVEAGQHIGWVGDSGNAENTVSHLHFELHEPDPNDGQGNPINPYDHLRAAEVLSEPKLAVWNGTFWDDDTSVHEANIDIIAEFGITRGCNPPTNDKYCPQRRITRGEMAAFLRRLLDLPASANDYFADDSESIFEGDINALAEPGIAFGCTDTEYCPDQDLLRREMAELLIRTFGYGNAGTDFFTDDDGNRFEESINNLANNGITKGCNPPDNTHFCPDRPLTRAEMATFLARALGLGT